MFRQDNDFGLYIRSVCVKYIGCTGCPLAGGVVTYFGDSTIICESGRGKANNEQATGNDGNGTSQAGNDESKE